MRDLTTSPYARLAVLALALDVVTAQQCYYPDGTKALDVPCNSTAPASACCTSFGYCLENGLCLDKGILSRGSCTDKSWKDPACAQYCKNDNPSGGQYLMACSNSSFTCDFMPENCGVASSTFKITNADSLILRSSQLTSAMEAAGVDSAAIKDTNPKNVTDDIKNSTAQPPPETDPENKFTAGDMAGVGAGVGMPLLLVIVFLLWAVVQERRKHADVSNTLAAMRQQPKEPLNSWSTGTGMTFISKHGREPSAAELPLNVVQELESPVATRSPDAKLNEHNRQFPHDWAKRPDGSF